MNSRFPFTLQACLLLSSIKGIAQNLEIGGVFPTVDHSGTISDKLEYSLYYFGAFNLLNPLAGGERESPYLGAIYSEQAMHCKINRAFMITGSYVYERQNPLKDTYRNENRFYLQGTLKYSVGTIQVKHRLRYDGRYIENRVTGKAPYTNRLRYLTGFTFPGRKNDKFYFSAYNEFFLNLDKRSTPIYGENWAFAGIGIKSKNVGSFEVGPLYIFWAASQKNDLINFYYLQFAWVTHLNLRKPRNS